MSRAAASTAVKASTQPRTGRSHAVPATAKRAPAPIDTALEQRVREAAYFIYERKGRVDGLELENWLEAEAELLSLEPQTAQRGSTAR